MKLGILIGFSIGLFFAIGILRLMRGAHLYFRFYTDGRLLKVEEIKERLGANVRLYLIKDLWIFNVIAYSRGAGEEDGVFPWRLFSDGLMLRKFCVSKRTLKREFPEAEIVEVSFPAFG